MTRPRRYTDSTGYSHEPNLDAYDNAQESASEEEREEKAEELTEDKINNLKIKTNEHKSKSR